jgi:hypothetical protein
MKLLLELHGTPRDGHTHSFALDIDHGTFSSSGRCECGALRVLRHGRADNLAPEVVYEPGCCWFTGGKCDDVVYK